MLWAPQLQAFGPAVLQTFVYLSLLSAHENDCDSLVPVLLQNVKAYILSKFSWLLWMGHDNICRLYLIKM